MKKMKHALLTGAILLIACFSSSAQYNLASSWNTFDASIHEGVIVEQYLSNQIGTNMGVNCHGYALWLAYGRTLPPSGPVVSNADVNVLISNGELVHLGTAPNPTATHVLYYSPIPAGQFFDPLDPGSILQHTCLISQFDCFPFVGQDFVQGRNGMSPATVLHKVNEYATGVFVPHYFRYSPATGALIPPDVQPACPPSVLICNAIVVNPVTCNNGNDGSVGVLHSTDAASTHSYAWSNGGSTPTITNLSPGTYTVTITESPTNETCTSTVTLTNPPANTAGATTTSHNGTVCITSPWGQVYGAGTATAVVVNVGNYSYQWSSYARNQTTQTATSLCSGNYSVVVTETNTGCEETIYCTVGNSYRRDAEFGRLKNGEMTVYPNPGSGEFTIEWEEGEHGQLAVKDASGRSVVERSVTGGETAIDLTSFGQGVYFVTLVTNEKIYTEKVNVE